MSAAYHERYGGNWLPLANGSDPSRFPPKQAAARGPDEPFVIRYMGALADDMTYASVCDVAHAVAGLAERPPVQLPPPPLPPRRPPAHPDFGPLPRAHVPGPVAGRAHPHPP